MPAKIIIAQNEVFGRLTVIGPAPNIDGYTAWLCQCECGNQLTTITKSLRNGDTKSCGCLQKERRIIANKTHGLSYSSEYRIWAAMKKRCLNPNTKQFSDYGGRGIIICSEWINSFETFYADMGKRPEGCSLDRINNEGNYEPSNCRWATRIEQCRNKRNNHLITYENETKSMTEWSEILGIKRGALKNRIESGWTIDRAFNQPIR
jgi:hypothetical protein